MRKIYAAILKKYGIFTFILSAVFSLINSSHVFGQSPVTITTSGTWVVPAGVTSIKVEAWGGGGAGGGTASIGFSNNTNRGSGGGGGAYKTANLTVTPGQTYTVTIGTGGIGNDNTNGGNGSASVVTGIGGTVTANPGLGGGRNSGAGGSGGAGDFNGGSGFTANANGGGGGGAAGNGGNGNNGTNTAGGAGGGGGIPGGKGGEEVGGTSDGNAGSIIGGGGGGSRSSGFFAVAGSGGAGARGQVVISYTIPPTITSLGGSPQCAGGTITINGTNLTGATAAGVTIGGTPVASITSNTGIQIVAVIGNGTTGFVSVTTPSGTVSSNPTNFTVNPLPQGSLTANGPLCATGAGQLTWTATAGTGPFTVIYNDGTANRTANNITSGTPFSVFTTPVTGTTTYTLVSVSNATCTRSSGFTGGSATITVNPLPQGSLTANGPFCTTGAGQLTWTATAGTGPFTVIYNDGTANRTANNVTSGTPFNVFTTPVTGTSTYTLVSVSNATCTRSSGFTGGSATITVNPLPQGSLTANGPFCVTGAGQLTWTATAGTGVFTVIYNDGTANRTANNVVSGTPFNVATNPVTSTTTYTLVSVANGTCTRSSSFTGSSATITVNPLPQGSLIANGPFCATGTGQLTWTATAGTGPFTVIYNDGTANRTANNLVSGTPFNVATNPVTSTTIYTLVSVTDNNGCPRNSGFTGNSATITVNQPVVITTQPALTQPVCATFPVSFTVIATGTGLTYQWYKTGIGALSNSGNISGATSATLTLAPAQSTDAGAYYVIVSGTAPCGPVQSNDVVLIVNQQIFITTQPSPQTVCAGTTATFTVSATGTGLMYQWRKGTTTLTNTGNISGANTATLTITNAVAGDAGPNYNVVITTLFGICPQANSANVALVVNPIPTVNAVTDKVVCNTAASGNVSFSGSGTAYNWTNDNTSIGLAAGGTGNIASFTATNSGSTPVTATITVTPTYTNAGVPVTTCTGTPITFTITVNPTPDVQATPASQVLCSGDATSIGLTSNVTGTTFSWTVTQSGVSGATASNGTAINQTLSATGNTPGTAVYTITPSANGCNGTAIMVTITVNPKPTVTATPTSQTLCSGNSTNIALGSNVAGATFSWTVVQTGVSGASNAGGSSINQALTATGSIPGTAVYTVTASKNGCDGTPITVTITVNPRPVATATPASQVICTGSATSIGLTSTVTGTTFTWTVAQSGVTGATSGNGNAIAQTLSTTGTAAGTATYTITPTANGCNGLTITVIITVNPKVTILPLAQEVCNGSAITPISISGLPIGTITSWTRNNPAGISSSLGTSGSGSISGTFSNTNSTSTNVTFNISAQTTNGCVTTATAVVTVDADLTAPVVSVSQIVCFSSTPAPLTSTTPTGGNNVYNLQWQHSNDGMTNWTDIPLANTSTYNPPNTSEFYRLKVTSCGVVYSNVVQIAIALDLGTNFNVSPNSATICQGLSGSFTASISSISFVGLFNTIKYSWQSQIPGAITSTTTNPYGSGFIIFNGTATFTGHNSTNAPIPTNLYITPTVYNGNTPYCNLSTQTIPVIINPDVTPGAISGNPTAICIGGTTTYSSNGTSGGTWSSLSPGIATVNSSTGLVTGVSAGAATIQYTVVGCNAPAPATKTVTVNPNVTPGTISGIPNNICIGATTTYTTNGTPGGIWSSSNPAAATVNASTGVVTGIAAGSADIRYTVTGCNAPAAATRNVTVSPDVLSGTISGSPTTICIGASTTYSSTGTSGGTWSSSNNGIATVNTGTGVVTGVSAGTVNIIYTVTGCNAPAPASLPVTISPNVISGTVSSALTTICISGTTTYTSSGTAGGSWSSSNPAVASVNAATGLVTGMSAGTANILYTPVGCNASAPSSLPVNVSPDANAGIVSGTSPLCIGTTATFTSDGDAGGTWSSSNTAVATVNASTGLVTALSAGTSDITYTVNSGCNNPKSSFATVTVSPNATAGTITGGDNPICVATNILLSATGDAGGMWSSDNTGVATVDPMTGVVTGVSAGFATITYTVTLGCNAPSSAGKMIEVQNVGAALNPGPITGPISVCASSSGFIYTVAPVTNAAFYVWTVPSGWTITTPGPLYPNTITVTSGATGGTITVQAGNACSISPGISQINVLASPVGQWIGFTPDWNDGQNWCSGTPPDNTMNVTIPVVGPGYSYPTVSTAIAMAHNLTIAAGASLTVTGNSIQVSGNITNSGLFDVTSGGVEMNGTVAQNIGANTFMNNAIQDLIISNNSGVSLGGALNVFQSLTYGTTDAKFNSNGFLTLKSNITGTAWIGPLATTNTISGDVTVERYINLGSGSNQHKSTWQLVATPTQGQTIKQTWMENGNNASTGYGTQITAPSGVAGGFDAISQTPSLKYYNAATATYIGVGNPTTTGVYRSKGYYLFVRGDRSIAYPNSGPTTLRTKGTLITGTTIPITVLDQQFESVGNPYASSVDLRKLDFTGGKVNSTIVVWDPTIGGQFGVGGFQTLTRLSDIDNDGITDYTNLVSSPGYGPQLSTIHNNIQSGQAFFMQSVPGNTGNLSFTESAKASGGGQLLMSPVRPGSTATLNTQLLVNLYGLSADGSTTIKDAALLQYNSSYSNAIDGMDARKFNNSFENVSVRNGSTLLAVERRALITQQDTIFLNVTNEKVQAYRFDIKAENLNSAGLQAFLEDSYLHTRTPLDLNGTTQADFNVANAVGSTAPGRFRIVFAPAVALPVTFTEIKAYRQAAKINIDWKVENEINIKNYTVEKSSDGLHFSTLTITAATGTGGSSVGYQATDGYPVNGYNYYRIRSNDVDGKTQVTRVVKVLMGSGKQGINIYPNPITDGMIHLQFMNEPEGKYAIRLLNKLGQVILSRQLTRMDGSSTELIKWDFNLAHGMYQLEITRPDGSVKNLNVMY